MIQLNNEVWVDLSFSLIKQRNWQELSKYDQLLNCKSTGEIFKDFNEHPLCFEPTFKVHIGLSEEIYKENRTPSWCDRVL